MWPLFCQQSSYSLWGCDSQSKLSMSKNYDSIFYSNLIFESKPPFACANKTIKISLLGISTLLFLLLDQFTVLGSSSSKKPRDGNGETPGLPPSAHSLLLRRQRDPAELHGLWRPCATAASPGHHGGLCCFCATLQTQKSFSGLPIGLCI